MYHWFLLWSGALRSQTAIMEFLSFPWAASSQSVTFSSVLRITNIQFFFCRSTPARSEGFRGLMGSPESNPTVRSLSLSLSLVSTGVNRKRRERETPYRSLGITAKRNFLLLSLLDFLSFIELLPVSPFSLSLSLPFHHPRTI